MNNLNFENNFIIENNKNLYKNQNNTIIQSHGTNNNEFDVLSRDIDDLFDNNNNFNKEIDNYIKIIKEKEINNKIKEDKEKFNEVKKKLNETYKNNNLEIIYEDEEYNYISRNSFIENDKILINLKLFDKKNLENFFINKYQLSYNEKDNELFFNNFKNKCNKMLTTRQIIGYHNFIEKNFHNLY